jgi:uncharacterized integral membrane protein
MNTKLLLKTLLAIFVALLLVLMGMNNPYQVAFRLPPLIKDAVNGPAALMYFAFFAVGLLTGVCLMAGSGKKGGGGSPKSGKG